MARSAGRSAQISAESGSELGKRAPRTPCGRPSRGAGRPGGFRPSAGCTAKAAAGWWRLRSSSARQTAGWFTSAWRPHAGMGERSGTNGGSLQTPWGSATLRSRVTGYHRTGRRESLSGRPSDQEIECNPRPLPSSPGHRIRFPHSVFQRRYRSLKCLTRSTSGFLSPSGTSARSPFVYK